MPEPLISAKLVCYHCGEDCPDDKLHIAEKNFCCQGCMLVYELLDKNGMCHYYELDSKPGVNRKIKVREGKFGFLDDVNVKSKLLTFSDGKQASISFYLPQMHCSSCIWLLENLHRLDPDILSSRVDFPKKEVDIVFSESKTTLRKVAELLTEIGYEPHISLKDVDEKHIRKTDRGRILRLGVAGFCFGNIMMLSFPEYFSLGSSMSESLRSFFKYLNLGLALPVFFYSSSEFYLSAWKGIKQKFLNIDAPIVLAIFITFGRSVFDILSGRGSGYLDSMSGIVFFMLAGRVFQDYTHQALSFERDYKSYFPLSVSVLQYGVEKEQAVSALKPGDRMVIRNGELIPADAILFLGSAQIDYSFVTGESVPVTRTIGEIVYAGGRQCGGKIELEVVKEVSQGYLTRLWNKDIFKEGKAGKKSFIHGLGKHFTWGLLALAAVTGIYWSFTDPSRILNSVTSVLIVACPCALLLSATFTNGNIMRILGRNGLYLKNADVIEAMAKVDSVVFDKTGTLTGSGASGFEFEGVFPDDQTLRMINALAFQSNHPLSRKLAAGLPSWQGLAVKQFREYPGSGIEAEVKGIRVRLGSSEFAGGIKSGRMNTSEVHLSLDGIYKGFFLLRNPYRKSVPTLIAQLREKYRLAVLSGDNAAEKEYLHSLTGPDADLNFEQSPSDKLDYILDLQQKNKRVLMVGDGLNDAGALRQSDVGISVTDDVNNFSPACDAILTSESFSKLGRFLEYAKASQKIIIASFIISVLYNTVGLAFAVQGTLSPVIAAILMPTSSVTILLFTTGASTLAGKWHFRKDG